MVTLALWAVLVGAPQNVSTIVHRICGPSGAVKNLAAHVRHLAPMVVLLSRMKSFTFCDGGIAGDGAAAVLSFMVFPWSACIRRFLSLWEISHGISDRLSFAMSLTVRLGYGRGFGGCAPGPPEVCVPVAQSSSMIAHRLSPFGGP